MHRFLPKQLLLFTVLTLLLGQIAFAQNDEALKIADAYLKSNLEKLRLTPADLQDYHVSDNYTSKHNGVSHIYLLQKHSDILVRNGMININILPNGEVLNMGNRFVSDLAHKVNSNQAQITARQAVETVIQTFNVQTEIPYILQETERISDQEIIFTHHGIALEPITASLVFEPMKDKSVRLAWQVELYEQSANDWWNARIDALTGDVLSYDNHVLKCEFGSLDDVCEEAHMHNHKHHYFPAIQAEESVESAMLSNAYNVLPLFIESPNHGEHALVENPSNTLASPYGWHDVDGEVGHEFTTTRGNNVHAYQDVFAQNMTIGDEPDGGDSLVFDFPFDPENNLPFTQIDAAVTNLFYWNNVIHDVWYQYGFDEVSGNFQQNNYGNGGVSGDAVRAECLDGSGTNNANFATPPDGRSGRMQMFFWGTGFTPSINVDRNFLVNSPESLEGEYTIRMASFGVALPDTNNPITGNVIIVEDDSNEEGSFTDACSNILNLEEINGNFALIDRGTCEFGAKALRAENAGAVAVIICNNQPGQENFIMPSGTQGALVSIPTFMISFEACQTLRAAAPDLTVSLSADYPPFPTTNPEGVDSDFDSAIITHEYGHGISIRLTGGPNNSGCLSFNNDEQMGEGWSDWFGLVMTTTSADNSDEPRGIGTFAIEEPTDGVGIRPFPYSRNLSVNPHTYADVNSEAVPHGVGSVWCAMLWDLYWNLVDEYGFDDDIYTGTGGNNMAMQLVIDGLKLQTCNPNFIDGRDAILAADQANYNGANQCLIWETFARRGLGFNAEQNGVQNFELPPLCRNDVSLEKTGDAGADAGELINYTLNIANGTDEDLSDYIVTDILPENTSYVEGSFNCGSATVTEGVVTFTVENLASKTITPCSYQVQIGSGTYSQAVFKEDFENGTDNWTFSNGTGTANWTLSNENSYDGNNSIFAFNPEVESDMYFSNTEPIVLSGENPSLGFWHSYDTDALFDGGIVELRIIGTSIWWDLGDFAVSNGYNARIDFDADNAINQEEAFTGNSGGYIFSLFDLSIFGNNSVEIRFRFASDGFNGGTGWHIDNIMIFEDIVQVENRACLIDLDGEEICSSAETTVFGVLSSNEDLAPQYRTAIFPNPTQDLVTFRVFNAPTSQVEVNIFSTDGRMVSTGQYNADDEFTVDMSDFGAGVYYAEIISGKYQSVQKVVVN